MFSHPASGANPAMLNLLCRSTRALPRFRGAGTRHGMLCLSLWLCSVVGTARVAAQQPGGHAGNVSVAPVASVGAPLARVTAPAERTLLDSLGRLTRPVTMAEVSDWKRQLAVPGIDRQRAGWLHLWIGEWQQAANQQPVTALQHFLLAEKLALPTEDLRGRAAVDRAIALDFEGAYADAAEAFHQLLMPKTALPGYDLRQCAFWYRHASICAGYHAERAKLGITEPPRLDPLCGAAGIAACLRSLGLPSDKKTVLSACHLTGEGSSVEDLMAACRKLGVSAYKVQADDTGLKELPKPMVAFVEHDHFVALVRADNRGVSYLCSDCGAWPGGRIDLTWKQWHAMEAGPYIAVTRKGSRDERVLASLRPVSAFPEQSRSLTQGRLRLHRRQMPQADIFRHAFVIRYLLLLSCENTKPSSPTCPNYCDEPIDNPGTKGGQCGDPVSLVTGEEEYRPEDDLVVYNPSGPAVRWGRVYNSLRQAGNDPGIIGPASVYNQDQDFGIGWSQHYNVSVYDPKGGGVGVKYVQYDNGAQTAFTASTAPTATQPRVACSVQPGAPILVEWDYDPNNTSGYYTITFPDRTQWITTNFISGPNCYALAQLRDRVGNAIYFNYNSPLTGYLWPLLASISTGPNGTGTTLLTIQRSSDGTGNITSVSDVYGRSVYYSAQYYYNFVVDGSHPKGAPNGSYQELEAVSQIVKTPTPNAPLRYSYGYQLVATVDPSHNLSVRFLHTITVPSPTGTGSSTATINYIPYTCYVSSLVDANGNSRSYTSVDSIHTKVTVQTAKGVTVYSYTAGFNTNMSETTRTNGAGAVLYTKNYSSGAADPYRPDSVTDGNGNTTSYTWDPYGHALTKTSPRNTVTTYTYDYSVFPLGELKSVQEGAKSPTTYAYDDSPNAYGFPKGLLTKITTPLPGTSGSSATVSYAFTYNSLGDPLTITTPGNNAASSLLTTLDYGPSPAIGEPLTITDNLGKAVHLDYDELGRLAAFTDQVGNTTGVAYNLAGQPLTITYPSTTSPTGATGSSSQKLSYLYVGGPLLSTTLDDESGHQLRQVKYTYGHEGELLSRTGGAEAVKYTYDAMYRVLTLTDGAAHKTTYTYNTAGYLASTKYPKGDTLKFSSYDALGDVLTRVDGRGITTTYKYSDPENLLTNINYPTDAAHNVAFSYDAYGRRSGMTDGTGSQAMGYDDNDLVTGVQTTYTGLPAQTIGYSYYPDSSRQGMTTPAGTFAYQYDGNGLLHALTNPFNETTTWNLTDNRLVKNVTLPNGVTSAYSFDARNRISSLLNATSGSTTLSSFTSMLYDAANNRATLTANDGTTTYSYDSKDELTQEHSTRAGGYTDSFAYDLAGNPTTFRGAANTFNTDNQFASSGYVYDGNGNPTTYQGTALAFDEENRLTGAGTLTAGYQGEGLRGWKQGAAGKVYFLYDNAFPVCEMDSSGNLLAVNTAYGDRVISRRTTSSDTFYVFDPQGNVAQKLDGSSNVLSSSVYDGFGAAKAGGATGDPFGFEAQFGYYTDTETGLQLLTFRYYDPGNGRFLTRDPISYDGGINLYGYVQNDPTVLTDIWGLSCLVYNESTHTVSLVGNDGQTLGQWTAYNNPDRGSSKFPTGTWTFVTHKQHPEDPGPNGSYGSFGIFIFDVPGHSGLGVHSGQANASYMPGPQHPTHGCIRTTDDAMDQIGNLIGKDPLTCIRVIR